MSEIELESNKSSDKINKRIEYLYKLKGLTIPKILIFDSPLSCKLAYRLILTLLNKEVNLAEQHLNFNNNPISDVIVVKSIMQRLKYQKDDSKTYESVRTILWDILKIKNSSWDSYSETSKNIYRYKLWNELINSKINYFEFDSNKYWNFDRELQSEGIFYGIFLRIICILCKKFRYILQDDKGNLHSEDGKAIEFDGGFGIYAIHGVIFDENLYKKIYINRTITPNEIIGIKNVEHRALAIQFFGYEKLIKELRAVKLDEWEGVSSVTNMPIFCELYEFSMARRRFRFVKVEDYSTHKITTLGVPAIEETESVMGAIAWTFGMEESEYRPKVQT